MPPHSIYDGSLSCCRFSPLTLLIRPTDEPQGRRGRRPHLCVICFICICGQGRESVCWSIGSRLSAISSQLSAGQIRPISNSQFSIPPRPHVPACRRLSASPCRRVPTSLPRRGPGPVGRRCWARSSMGHVDFAIQVSLVIRASSFGFRPASTQPPSLSRDEVADRPVFYQTAKPAMMGMPGEPNRPPGRRCCTRGRPPLAETYDEDE